MAAPLAALLAFSGPAAGAPCAGFTDVDSTSTFCPNVEWLKNRGVTLGCTSATLYCPGDVVSRLAMAAFLNRLADALRPVRLANTDSIGAQDVDANPVVCRTPALAVSGFPRTAYAGVTFAALGSSVGGISVGVVMTTDGGTSWTPLAAAPLLGQVSGTAWRAFTHLGLASLEVGQTVRFGVQLGRAGLPGPGDVASGVCQLGVAIYSRDGSASPL